jgi:hypothetical protein
MYPILIASADPYASLLVSKNRKIEMIQVFNRNDLKFVRYLGDESVPDTGTWIRRLAGQTKAIRWVLVSSLMSRFQWTGICHSMI